MRFLDEFRDKEIARGVIERLDALAKRLPEGMRLMEVCGTHTMALSRSGIRRLLPGNIKLVSGPGCPVCVTSQEYIDTAIILSGMKSIVLACFGDMIRVPGTDLSLEKAKAAGADVNVVYSPLDALRMAQDNPMKKVVFLAVGFETTIPTTAVTLVEAEKAGVGNFFALCAHKVMPPALEALCSDPALKINGFVLPGHVSVITGSAVYEEIARKYKVPCVVTGFEPLDMLQGIYMLAMQSSEGGHQIQNQYARVVTSAGNAKAQKAIAEVFEPCDASWRGIGVIHGSGLRLNARFARFDAEKAFGITPSRSVNNKACRCGEVLKGVITPPQCRMFAKACTPENPIGPCMVSSEGTCAAYYKYERN